MNIQYILADPSGNKTILVTTPVEKCQHSTLAEKLLALPGTGAEQVGYLTMDAGKPLRVDMMGGEFCGNASRSAAAYALKLSGKSQGLYDVSCSGYDGVLQAKTAAMPDGSYEAFIEMPYPENVSALIMAVGDQPVRFFRVDLPGITHFVTFTNNLEGLDKNVYWQALQDYVADENLAAYGLVLCDTQKLTMIPAVYVRGTATLYWEQSCGSGSAAVAAALACVNHQNVACHLQQPGGRIAIAAKVGSDGDEKGRLQQIFIGGPITFSAEQTIDV